MTAIPKRESENEKVRDCCFQALNRDSYHKFHGDDKSKEKNGMSEKEPVTRHFISVQSRVSLLARPPVESRTSDHSSAADRTCTDHKTYAA